MYFLCSEYVKCISFSFSIFCDFLHSYSVGYFFSRRKPSWTDRILYKVIANNYENITLRADLLSYNHVPFYTLSDHKPVIAQFNIKVSIQGEKTLLYNVLYIFGTYGMDIDMSYCTALYNQQQH